MLTSFTVKPFHFKSLKEKIKEFEFGASHTIITLLLLIRQLHSKNNLIYMYFEEFKNLKLSPTLIL